MNKRREATFAKGRMVPGNLDNRFGLTFRAVHASMIRAGLGGLQTATLVRPLLLKFPSFLYKPCPFATVQQAGFPMSYAMSELSKRSRRDSNASRAAARRLSSPTWALAGCGRSQPVCRELQGTSPGIAGRCHTTYRGTTNHLPKVWRPVGSRIGACHGVPGVSCLSRVVASQRQPHPSERNSAR